MELLSYGDYYILKNGENSLWCSKVDASLIPKSGDACKSLDTVCHGIVYGLIGLFNTDKLILIRQSQLIGVLPKDHHVFKIQRIIVISLNPNEPITEVTLDHCKTHQKSQSQSHPSNANHGHSSGVQKTWNQIKSTAAHVKPRNNRVPQNETRDKYDKRIHDELYKMFNDTDSFYYSYTGDLTNSIQRQYKVKHESSVPLWKRVDDRFFWNKYMLSSLIESGNELANSWIIPIIQGFVQIECCSIDISSTSTSEWKSMEDIRSPVKEVNDNPQNQEEYKMTLISRRSRFRAGTRYKRRGVDEMGKCANYVETEQIFEHRSHLVSFVITRGSVPVFWSQPGFKYRPPPRVDRSEEETQLAFNAHFDEELSIYNSEVIINLVEQSGREKIIADAYINHVLNYDSPFLTYVTFDFHDYCRGMKFENISVLIDSTKDIIKDMRYCWVDTDGVICEQRGTFRINCIDCLDRTNIAETAIARTVMDTQFIRLGLLPPEGQLPLNCRRVFQMLWANNGDIISRQYAGTAALKSDFTRTGERRITGVVKDGYNSANRYYMNRFKDAYRQATIDIMQGIPVSDDLNSPDNEIIGDNTDSTISNEHEHHERVKMVIDDCNKILIPDNEVVLGGWPLIDADTGYASHSDLDMDTVLILTKDSYYIAEYDDQTDRIIKYQRVLLEDLEKIELGPEPNQIFSIKSKLNYCIRLHYLIDGLSGYFHMFRSTNTRFFNNMAIPILNPEEAMESLKAICESFKVALSVKSLNVPFFEGKLERRKSKVCHVVNDINKNTQNRDLLSVGSQMPRNVSDGQLLNLKNVGTRALTNVSSHFARLKGKWSSNGKHTLKPVTEPKGAVAFNVESSGEDESEDDSLRKLKKQKHKGFNISTLSDISIAERSLSSDFSECSDIEDHEEITPMVENRESLSVKTGNTDSLLESCGILATSPTLGRTNLPVDDDGNIVKSHKHSLLHEFDDFILDAMKKASLRQLHRKASESQTSIGSFSTEFSSMPQIQIIDDENGLRESAIFTSINSEIGNRTKMVSISSEDLEISRTMSAPSTKTVPSCSSVSCATLVKVYSDQNKIVNDNTIGGDAFATNVIMKTSHSETAIQDISSGLSLNLQNVLSSSPILIKKDLVLSPLSRIAKGVQNLGLNLRSGASSVSSNQGRRINAQHSQNDSEAYRVLKNRKSASKTRILELTVNIGADISLHHCLQRVAPAYDPQTLS